MVSKERNISSLDYFRLMDQIHHDVGHSAIPAENLHQLYVMLETAHKIRPEEMPSNVVTMNSEVVVRYIGSGKSKTIRIVYPDGSAYPQSEKGSGDSITAYNPLAISVLGLQEHDLFFSRQGDTEEPVIIDKIVFQPEAQGIFNL